MEVVFLAALIAPLVLALRSLCIQIAAQTHRIDLLDQQLARLVIAASIREHRNRQGATPPAVPGSQVISAETHDEQLHPDSPLRPR